MWIHSKEGNLFNLSFASAVVIRPHKTKDGLFELVVIFPGVASSPSGIPIPDQHSVFEGNRQEVVAAKLKLAERLSVTHIEGVSVS